MGAKQSSENPPSEKMNSTKKYKHMAAKKSEKNILWFEEVGANKKDLELVGGKNSSLGCLFNMCSENTHLKVPNGFALSTIAYKRLITDRIKNDLKDLLEDLEVENLNQAKLDKVSRACRQIVYNASGECDWLRDAIEKAYMNLCQFYCGDTGEEVSIAVRSSATAEDLPSASFAGQHDSFLNISGVEEVIEAARKVIASLFTSRAIAYRHNNDFDHFAVSISVGFQKMVCSSASGVCFTMDTESGCEDVVLVTAGYGLGENVVQGSINPDEWLVHKPTFRLGRRTVLKHVLGEKSLTMRYNEHGSSYVGQKGTDNSVDMVRNEPTPIHLQRQFCMSDKHVLDLVEDALTICDAYGKQMDIEFALDSTDGAMYVVQARPETAFGDSSHRAEDADSFETYECSDSDNDLQLYPLITSGSAIGQKAASGAVFVCRELADLTRFQDGQVLVTEMTTPDMVPVLKRSAGVVTLHGGRTCHAAIVARELGVPAAVGVTDALNLLTPYEGQVVTVLNCRGSLSEIRAGKVPFTRSVVNKNDLPHPRTTVSVNLGDPSLALRSSCIYREGGVGLARMEYVITNAIGVHPMACAHPERVLERERVDILERSRLDSSPHEWFVRLLSEELGLVAAAYYPMPVNVRLSDFKSNEYAQLLGGSSFEPKEENPMLGFRGAARYTHEKYMDGFALECQAVRRLRDYMGLHNVEVMVPFCRTVQEAQRVLALMASHGLYRSSLRNVRGELVPNLSTLKEYPPRSIKSDKGSGKGGVITSTPSEAKEGTQEWESPVQGMYTPLRVNMMVEVPSNVILIDQFSALFDGFSIGSNDLTQLVLGCDRDSAIMAPSFDDMDPAVLNMIELAIQGARRAGKSIGICGESPASNPELVKLLVEAGISYISVNPNSVLQTLRACDHAEKQLDYLSSMKESISRGSGEKEDYREEEFSGGLYAGSGNKTDAISEVSTGGMVGSM